MSQDTSITPWRRDEEHIRFDCDSIIAAARRRIDKVIYMPPLFYLSLAGKAVVLDIQDKFACILSGHAMAAPLPIAKTGEEFAISWPFSYRTKGSTKLVIFCEDTEEIIVSLDIRGETYEWLAKATALSTSEWE